MKQDFTLTAYYFLYIILAVFSLADKKYTSSTSTKNIVAEKKAYILDEQKTEILHGELLFKF